MSERYDFDLFVVGGGSGGVRAARVAAELGARVALAEESRLGGTCVNVGCIPKKLLVYASEFAREVHDARAFGWSTSTPQLDFRQLTDAMDLEVLRLNAIYRQRLEQAGVTLLRGRAELLDGHVLSVAGQRYTSRYVLIATGGAPQRADFPGQEHALVSDQVFALQALPERLAIIGAGYIGVEFAGIFCGLGARVHLVHRGAHVLAGFDADVREHLTQELARSEISLHMSRRVARIDKHAQGLSLVLDDHSTLEVDHVLLAVGRQPRARGLGLERAGVELDSRGGVRVDARSRTNVEHIYAVGDVTARRQLTPVAIAEGEAVVRELFGEPSTPLDYDLVPSAVFSQPNVGTVGLSEHAARERHSEIDVYKSHFRPLKHALTGREKRTLLKLIVERASQRVLGLHMVGDHAGEIVQGFAVAMNMGATKADFDRTLGVHPTSAEEFVTMRNKVTA
jgi:glutathione reductase (NADPH)